MSQIYPFESVVIRLHPPFTKMSFLKKQYNRALKGGLAAVVSGTLLASDKCHIDYVHYKNDHKKAIIIAHGFYNSKDAIILRRLAKKLAPEYDVFMFDFRGHGKSGGLFSWTSKEDRDLRAVLEFLEGKYEKTGLIAFSMGGSVSINVLSQGSYIDSLICVSVPSNVNKIDYKFWKLDVKNDLWYTLVTKEGRKGKGIRPGPFWFKKTKPVKSVEKLKIPVLYIHGTSDWVVEPWHSQALYDKTNSKKKLVFIHGGVHAEYLMKESEKEFVKEVKGWFRETLS
ncbi:MAG: alpha/beta fold hydrolase [Candidatus Omnitrophica bacterium]|nr:alpha/beta fold hydrolase [Candidatus Omnitrophota bacterium]